MKLMLFSLLLPLLTSAMPNPALISCGEFLDENRREFLFELYDNGPGSVQSFYVNVGWPHNFKNTTVQVTQYKQSTGFLSHNVIFDSGDGRFRLEKSNGLLGGSDNWILKMNLPEIELVYNSQQAQCLGLF
jgi:hypothetical protein